MVEKALSNDETWMRRALAHAERGLGQTSPNPVVGACVVTADGVVVGDGAHERAGGPHAEVLALDQAGPRACGATLYCTLEPCVHTGFTGPCTERILTAKIRRVVIAVKDPDPRVNGRGASVLRAGGIDVDVGVCHEEATELNQPFFTAVRLGRPFVILKAATSLDGRLSSKVGTRTFLTSEDANRYAHHTRAKVDAIAVGSETVLVDDPLLTVREKVFRERPLIRVIFDRRLRTPPTAKIFSTRGGPVIIMTSEKGVSSKAARVLEEAGATVVSADGTGLLPMLQRLMSFNVQSVLLEGGAMIHSAAWDENLVDYVQLYVTPHILGGNGVPLLEGKSFSSAALVRRQVKMLGNDVIIEGYVHRSH